MCYCMRATSQLFRCRFVLATPLSVASMESNGPTDDRENDSFLLKRRPVLGGGVAELSAGDDDAGAAAVLVTPVQFPRRLLIFLRPTLLPPPCRCTGGSVSPALASPRPPSDARTHRRPSSYLAAAGAAAAAALIF